MTALITTGLLAYCGTASPVSLAPVLDAVAARHGITTPARVQAWLANVLNESGLLERVAEDMTVRQRGPAARGVPVALPHDGRGGALRPQPGRAREPRLRVARRLRLPRPRVRAADRTRELCRLCRRVRQAAVRGRRVDGDARGCRRQRRVVLREPELRGAGGSRQPARRAPGLGGLDLRPCRSAGRTWSGCTGWWRPAMGARPASVAARPVAVASAAQSLDDTADLNDRSAAGTLTEPEGP